MPKIPPLKAKTLIKILLKAGFYEHHQKGSHVQLRHRTKTELRVTIPRHDRFDLPPFVVLSILNQADITRKDFLDFLDR